MMLSLRSRSLFSSPISLTFSPPKRPPKSSISFKSSRSISPIAMAGSQTVEHIVLFKVQPGADPSKVEFMLAGLNDLSSLDGVVHLTAGPVYRTESPDLSFTHMLHSRYASKDDLAAYSAHPSHLGVVKESVLPICDDIMVVDWVAGELPDAAAPNPGSAIRVAFLKLKEGEGQTKGKILSVLRENKLSFGDPDEISWGVNFSPARAKGFSVATLAGFPGVEEMTVVDSNQLLVNGMGLFEGVLVVDYVVPSPSL